MAERSSELENTSEFSSVIADDYALATTDESELEAASSEEEIADEPEQIRTQIEETRAQMGETIDAIQEKLSFSNISEQVSEQINSAVETAKGAVYDATVGKAGTFMKNLGSELSNTKLVKTAMDHPFPFVLIGIGVGLLAYNGFGGKRRSNGRDTQTGTSSGTSTFKTAQKKLGGAYESVSGAASTAYGNVANAASSAYEGVGSFAGTAREKVGDLGSQAREQYDYYIEENPLAVGAVALALGAAVGFSIPSTSYEGELMGEARHNLLQKAQDTAGELVDKVKEVAGEARKTIGEEVKTAVNEVKAAGSTQ